MQSESKTFGRIPVATVALLESTVAKVKNKVVTALPASTSEDLRAYTLERVLETVLRDWHENGNQDGLSDLDLNDLESFVRISVELAGKPLEAQGKPIYKAALEGLLEDWLYNWNSDGGSGPPASDDR